MNPLTKDLGEVLKDLPEDPDSRTLYLLFKFVFGTNISTGDVSCLNSPPLDLTVRAETGIKW